MAPAQLSAMLLDTLKKQYAGATSAPLTGTVAGASAEGYTLTFTHMGVPMTGVILSFRAGASSFTMYTQAADDDLPLRQPAFDLVKNTLVVR